MVDGSNHHENVETSLIPVDPREAHMADRIVQFAFVAGQRMDPDDRELQLGRLQSQLSGFDPRSIVIAWAYSAYKDGTEGRGLHNRKLR